MDAARLSVVQPGTRANFMRRVVDAMRALVPAPATFFCLGTNEARAYAEGARVVDGASAPMPPCGTLTEAFGLDARSLVSSGRRAYLADELYPGTEPPFELVDKCAPGAPPCRPRRDPRPEQRDRRRQPRAPER